MCVTCQSIVFKPFDKFFIFYFKAKVVEQLIRCLKDSKSISTASKKEQNKSKNQWQTFEYREFEARCRDKQILKFKRYKTTKSR